MIQLIRQLQKSYTCRYGAPVISAVDTNVFHVRYFTHCSSCTFCNDWCCSFGVDVDVENVKRIDMHADGIEKLVGIPRDQWFEPEIYTDAEYPGGAALSTNVVNGACIFLNRSGRGCLLQTNAMKHQIDYHELKPMVSVIFPLTFGEGILMPAEEVDDQSLVCMGTGLTLYRALRDELTYYFGEDMVQELDQLEEEEKEIREMEGIAEIKNN